MCQSRHIVKFVGLLLFPLLFYYFELIPLVLVYVAFFALFFICPEIILVLTNLVFSANLDDKLLRKELSENQRHCRQLQSQQQKNQLRPPLAKATRIDGGGDAEAAVQQLPHLYLRGRRDPLAAAASPYFMILLSDASSIRNTYRRLPLTVILPQLAKFNRTVI